jgi:hypothetical protein
LITRQKFLEANPVLENQQLEARRNDRMNFSGLKPRQEAVNVLQCMDYQEGNSACALSLTSGSSEHQLQLREEELEEMKRSLNVTRLELELSESAKQLALDDLSSTR